MNLVIGAGIFGICAAIKLKKEGLNVEIIEKENDILLGASKYNHNRIHYGFHYPRSLETGLQSLEGYKSFYDIFKNCIIDDFNHYYMIEATGKINSEQYEIFCNKLNIFYKKNIFPPIKMSVINIENSFLTNEPIFDYNKMKEILLKYIKLYKIKIIYNKEITNINQLKKYKNIINTTYVNINKINKIFKIPLIKLKIQDVIIPIFEMENERIGITIMDGDFCSILPKGNKKQKFLLYNVKYSVIRNIEGYFVPNDWDKNNIDISEKIDIIYKESSKYYSFLKNCKKVSYWRTYRAIPINNNDERLSSIYINKKDDHVIYTIISGKITTSNLVAEKLYEKIKV